MKLNLISKSIILSSLAITSFYGFQNQQELEGEAGIDKTESLKASKLSVVGKAKNHAFSVTKPVIPITEVNNTIDDLPEIEDFNKGTSEVNFEKGLLSITAKDAVLTEVLAQVSNKVDIPIAAEAIESNQRVTLTVHNVTVDTGLKELIAGYDYFFLYDGRNERLKATWIYPAGTGQTVALSNSDPQQELGEDDLYSSDPVSRVLALQQHAASGNKGAINQLNDALSDTDPNVRVTAILSAQENAIALPVLTLKEMAASDTSALVRSVALSTLSMNPDLSATAMTELAEKALNDRDESVREEAEAILDGFEENETSETSSQLLSNDDEYEEIS